MSISLIASLVLKRYYVLNEDIFRPNDVELISMQESFDTSTAFGSATVGMLSVFAQLERKSISERMITGRVERAKGFYHTGGQDRPLLVISLIVTTTL